MAGAHSDFGLFTLLLCKDPGLQILVDGSWQDLTAGEDAIIVNLGDQLQRYALPWLERSDVKEHPLQANKLFLQVHQRKVQVPGAPRGEPRQGPPLRGVLRQCRL